LLDLDALFLRPALLRPFIDRLADSLRGHQPDAVCGPADGGAFLALALADILDVLFLPAARAAQPPDGAQPPAGAGYRLPRVPARIDDWRVVIADDAVNAGTAVQVCSHLLRSRGATPVAVAALLALGPASDTIKQALSVPFHAVESIKSQAWPAVGCDLCAAGIPLTSQAPAELPGPSGANYQQGRAKSLCGTPRVIPMVALCGFSRSMSASRARTPGSRSR
jgi:orotate phosphoribosyltransferase